MVESGGPPPSGREISPSPGSYLLDNPQSCFIGDNFWAILYRFTNKELLLPDFLYFPCVLKMFPLLERHLCVSGSGTAFPDIYVFSLLPTQALRHETLSITVYSRYLGKSRMAYVGRLSGETTLLSLTIGSPPSLYGRWTFAQRDEASPRSFLESFPILCSHPSKRDPPLVDFDIFPFFPRRSSLLRGPSFYTFS